jgi:hypothetical protein
MWECGGCAARRKAMNDAWMRIKKMGLMSNGNPREGQSVVTPAERDALAAQDRTAQHEAMMQRQKAIAEQAITSRR